MWNVRTFQTFQRQEAWIKANAYRYQITRLYLQNEYGVEFRKLAIPRLPR